jgi:hypothetical protein
VRLLLLDQAREGKEGERSSYQNVAMAAPLKYDIRPLLVSGVMFTRLRRRIMWELCLTRTVPTPL